jgi:hypothetical protein
MVAGFVAREDYVRDVEGRQQKDLSEAGSGAAAAHPASQGSAHRLEFLAAVRLTSARASTLKVHGQI